MTYQVDASLFIQKFNELSDEQKIYVYRNIDKVDKLSHEDTYFYDIFAYLQNDYTSVAKGVEIVLKGLMYNALPESEKHKIKHESIN